MPRSLIPKKQTSPSAGPNPVSSIIERGFLSLLAGALLASSAFAQTPTPDGSVRFLALGDWGREGKYVQKPVAAQMGTAAAAARSQFIVALGDNFYYDGVSDVAAKKWKTSFEDVYTVPSLQIPWYAVLGNHDYHSNAQAQVDYSQAHPRWRMPARYYTFTRPIDAGTNAQFFMLDSSPYVYRMDPAGYGDISTQDPALQTAWLERELAQSTAQWKIVCSHHPVYSASKIHGDTPELVAAIEPLLEKYGVQVFLSGHSHDLQHLRVGAIDYFSSGAGAQPRDAARDARTVYSLGDTGGFLAVTLTPEEFQGRFIDHAGKVLYTATLPRRRAR